MNTFDTAYKSSIDFYLLIFAYTEILCHKTKVNKYIFILQTIILETHSESMWLNALRRLIKNKKPTTKRNTKK